MRDGPSQAVGKEHKYKSLNSEGSGTRHGHLCSHSTRHSHPVNLVSAAQGTPFTLTLHYEELFSSYHDSSSDILGLLSEGWEGILKLTAVLPQGSFACLCVQQMWH